MTETATLTLTDFLLARIAEDLEGLSGVTQPVRISEKVVTTGGERVRVSGYVFAPERARAECTAKRRIVAVHEWRYDHCEGCDPYGDGGPEPCLTLPHLAAVYADHPDFREEWRP